MGLEVFGIFLAAIIQGIMITIYGKKYSCKDLEAMENQSLSLSNSSQSAFLVPNEYSKLVIYLFVEDFQNCFLIFLIYF